MTGFATGVPQPSVSSLLTLGQAVTLDLSDSLLVEGVLDGEGSADVSGVALGLALSGEGSLGSVDLLSGRVELLELAALAGEEDETGLVVLKAVDVGDERLLGVVDTAVVNGDTDGAGELGGDASFLDNSGNPCKFPFIL